MQAIEKIKSNKVYQQVLKDSFGGIMYNVANRNKYNTSEIMKLWDSMTPSEREHAAGIMKGAINFLNGN